MTRSPRRENLECISRLSNPSESFTTRSYPAMAFSTCACVVCLKTKNLPQWIFCSFSKIQYFLALTGFFVQPVLNLPSCLLFLLLFATNKHKNKYFSFLQVFDLNYFFIFCHFQTKKSESNPAFKKHHVVWIVSLLLERISC